MDRFSPDCENCAALCCVLLPFDKGDMFAASKSAGRPCKHLEAGHRCGIHGALKDRGYQGCAQFDCLGAGQVVTRGFGDRHWRDGPETTEAMTLAFRWVSDLQETARMIDMCRGLAEDPALVRDLDGRLADLDSLLKTVTAPDAPALARQWITRSQAWLRALPADHPELATRIRGLIAARQTHT